MRNTVLIGMPGAGEHDRVILAKVLGMNFVDTDLVIQERTGLRLQAIIDRDGPAGFLKAEERWFIPQVQEFGYCHGRQVVMSPRAMEHLISVVL